ncbi:hypothetical protein BOX15_Mlig015031g1 [Macrostomum lignano]|nr:hypothetical protein BOX15_Mlig009114g6 [Macrostomum lignano]PAA63687.1 hypothetical protein BOX15_Mlig009114g2 [Macrostomum lignano]PAA72678.1 hypothetical protein BOX15_Mlig009114g1 [Macrostomum lignano]PAA76015.1 hypothetical protein BOX15_Mlig015031g1 [Macrostomum lignano]
MSSSTSQKQPRKVLIAVDGSAHSNRALNWYAANLASPDDQLVFAYVAEPPPVSLGAGYASAVSAELYTNSVKEAVHAGHRLAAELRDRCDQLGLPTDCNVRFVERLSANPGQALVAIATEEDASLIVVGNRGIGALRRTFLGSVSDYVLHHAHRPVAIVPPPHP